MANKRNRYKQKAKKKHFLSDMNDRLPSKGNVKNTVLETGKDILIGVLGGGLLGAVIGKPSLGVGILTTGAGHYTGNRLVQLVGIGLMAANGFQKSETVAGLEGLEGVKERLHAYKLSLQEKFYLDKLLKKNAAAVTTTNGFGELQYFNYPNVTMNGELAALDDIERQIAESAMQFQGQITSDTDLTGSDDLMGANDYQFDVGELEERLY